MPELQGASRQDVVLLRTPPRLLSGGVLIGHSASVAQSVAKFGMLGAPAALDISSENIRIAPLPNFQLALYDIGGVRIRLGRIGVLL